MEKDIIKLTVENEDGTVEELEFELLFTLPHEDENKEYIVFTDIDSDELDDDDIYLYKAIRDTSSGNAVIYSIPTEEEEEMLDKRIDEIIEDMESEEEEE